MYYSEKYKVTSHDVDTNDNIMPSAMMRYMQETANHQMRDRKPSYYDFFGEGMSFVITRMSLEVTGSIRQYDEIEVRTYTAGEKGAIFYRGYEIYLGDELLAKAIGEWVMTGFTDGKIYRASDVDLSNYESSEKPELLIPTKWRMPKDVDMKELGTHHVYYSDCDMNMHMNNTNYANMLWDLVPEIYKKEVTSLNLRFRTEAPLGCDISITGTKVDPQETGDAKAEEAYMFRSYVDGKPNLEAMLGLRATELSPYANLYNM